MLRPWSASSSRPSLTSSATSTGSIAGAQAAGAGRRATIAILSATDSGTATYPMPASLSSMRFARPVAGARRWAGRSGPWRARAGDRRPASVSGTVQRRPDTAAVDSERGHSQMNRTLAGAYPKQTAALWDRGIDGNPLPTTVSPGSKKALFWHCPTHNYKWTAGAHSVRSWSKGFSGCPRCAGKASRTDADYHELAARRGYHWLGPTVVGVKHKTQWRCRKGHEWAAPFNDISSGYGCPACAGKVVTAENSLKAVHPQIAAEWHPSKNGSLAPDSVQRSSHKVVWWRCKTCGSDWNMSVNTRDNGQGCPYCRGRRVNGTNSLAARHPELVAQWHRRKTTS